MTPWQPLSLGVMLVLAPALPGVAAKTRAVLTGRRGAPVLQLYWDLLRLLRKGAVYSTTMRYSRYTHSRPCWIGRNRHSTPRTAAHAGRIAPSSTISRA